MARSARNRKRPLFVDLVQPGLTLVLLFPETVEYLGSPDGRSQGFCYPDVASNISKHAIFLLLLTVQVRPPTAEEVTFVEPKGPRCKAGELSCDSGRGGTNRP